MDAVLQRQEPKQSAAQVSSTLATEARQIRMQTAEGVEVIMVD